MCVCVCVCVYPCSFCVSWFFVWVFQVLRVVGNPAWSKTSRIQRNTSFTVSCFWSDILVVSLEEGLSSKLKPRSWPLQTGFLTDLFVHVCSAVWRFCAWVPNKTACQSSTSRNCKTWRPTTTAGHHPSWMRSNLWWTRQGCAWEDSCWTSRQMSLSVDITRKWCFATTTGKSVCFLLICSRLLQNCSHRFKKRKEKCFMGGSGWT